LVWSQGFELIIDAIGAERQIKRWSRAKKEALIRGALHLLPELSKRGVQAAGRTVLSHPADFELGASSFETTASRSPQDEAQGTVVARSPR
jgi:hypothetical protein